MSNSLAESHHQSIDQTLAARAKEQPARWRDPLGVLWRLLQRPWLLIALGVCALLLIICALFLPQIPTEIADTPPAVSRWLTEQSSNLPFGGNIVRALGLFDVLHSAFLRLLLTLIGLTLLIHFADLIATALHLYRLPKQITKAVDATSGSVPILSPAPLYQRGSTISTSDAASHLSQTETLQTYLSQRFQHIIEVEADEINRDAQNGAADHDPESETRILARRNMLFALLRPLLMLGLILSLIPVWSIIINGWELAPAPLAPGAFKHYESNQLYLGYEIATESSNGSSEEGTDLHNANMNLRVQVGDNEQIYPINGSLRTTLNQVEIRAAAGPPALRISTIDGQERLALQGQSAATAAVGLVFSEPGNEGIVLIPSTIPDEAAILRIVRGPEVQRPNYLLEIISPNAESATQAQPDQSIRMQPSENQRLEIRASNVSLQIDSVSSLTLNARYLPSTWIFIPAILLVLIGALGYWRQPTFLLAQLIQKRADQTIAIYQSDSKAELQAALESSTLAPIEQTN